MHNDTSSARHVNLITEHCFIQIRQNACVFFYAEKECILCQEINFKE